MKKPIVLLVGIAIATTFLGFGLNRVEAKGTIKRSLPIVYPASWRQMNYTGTHNAVYGAGYLTHGFTVATGGTGNASSVSVVSGVIYTSNFSGDVVAISATTGKILWSTKLANQVMTSPLVAHGLVYVGMGNKNFVSLTPQKNGNVLRGTGVNGVVALSQKTGKQVFSYKTKGEVMPTLYELDKVLYLATGGGHIRALDALTGKPLWSTFIQSFVSMSSLNRVGNNLIVGGDNPHKLYAINMQTHKVTWATTLPGAVSGVSDCSAAVSNGIIYIDAVSKAPSSPNTQGVAGVSSQTLYAVSANTGRVLWHYNEGTGINPGMQMETGTPTVVGQTVYVGSPVTNQMIALNALTGKKIWAYTAHGMVKGAPVVSHGILYFGDMAGYLYAVDASNGLLRGVQKHGGQFGPGGPVMVNHMLVIPNTNGKLYTVPIGDLLGKNVPWTTAVANKVVHVVRRWVRA